MIRALDKMYYAPSKIFQRQILTINKKLNKEIIEMKVYHQMT